VIEGVKRVFGNQTEQVNSISETLEADIEKVLNLLLNIIHFSLFSLRNIVLK
jgi:hypothetical protein